MHVRVSARWARHRPTLPANLNRGVQADIGVSENTAKLMRFRDSIASDYWASVVAHAKVRKIKGVSLELLARLKAEKKIIAVRRKAA